MLKSTFFDGSCSTNTSDSNMQQRGSDRDRPFKQYDPNRVGFAPMLQTSPQEGQGQGQPLQGQGLFDFDDSSLLSVILNNHSHVINSDLMQNPDGLQGMTSQGMSHTGNGMQVMPQDTTAMPRISQSGGMLPPMSSSAQVSSEMPLPSISSTSSGSSVSNMYGPNFLTGIGSALAQDQDMTNYLSGFTPSLQLQGGMMSQQPGGMVHNVSGQDMQQPIGGHGQLSSNGQQMPPIQYPPDMNIPNYANLKMEKAGEMYPSPPASSAVAAHNSAGPGNGNSAGPGNGNSAGPGNGNGNGNGTNSLSPDSPPVGGQSSLSSVPGSPAKSCTSREDIDSSTEGDGSKKSPKKRLINVPEDQKDEAYWEKRRKNNESAKRSRESRRIKEEQIAMKVVVLEQENLALKTEIDILKTEVENLRRMLYNPGPILPNHM